MTKKDFFDAAVLVHCPSLKGNISHNINKALMQAMDQYAIQQASRFSEFAAQQAWLDNDTNLWNTFDETLDPFRFTSEDLYTEFLKYQESIAQS